MVKTVANDQKTWQHSLKKLYKVIQVKNEQRDEDRRLGY